MDPEKAAETKFPHSLRAYPAPASRPGAAAGPASADLGRLFDSCPDLLCITDLAGQFEYVNPAWMRCLGWEQDVLVGSPLISFVHPNHREASRTEIEKLAAGATSSRFEHRFRRSDGAYCWLQWHVRVAPDDDRLYGTVRDVTRRKRLEREILEILDHERMRLGQELHDGLCQHLAGIAALSWRLATRMDANPEVSDGAAEISRLLNDSIGEARDLVRGLVPAGLEDGDLADALSFLAQSIENLFEIPCELCFDGQVPALTGPVKQHLFRIAQEAARNSAVHSGADRIEISLRCEDAMLSLCVRDNGNGIPHSITGLDGFGLHTMTYRSRQIGAALHIGPDEGGGTIVCCDLPVRETPEHCEDPADADPDG